MGKFEAVEELEEELEEEEERRDEMRRRKGSVKKVEKSDKARQKTKMMG